jgi:hypothetical protein
MNLGTDVATAFFFLCNELIISLPKLKEKITYPCDYMDIFYLNPGQQTNKKKKKKLRGP